ncbi:Crp/Fnr family transcriptional regulator [Saccharothrix australiensis]|uniref:CRP-like cAMP-binding protein n=1 Tax=Saccharothrix australiensis TaxID=2072 RepID=A0A495W9U6_9PSEU|nr:Crp/Fnr family transcriptional regulator [Saccharothrix australiensis]RKT57900.1 CRP-like cAMP-binding protein [Saccharothrix australiensis]
MRSASAALDELYTELRSLHRTAGEPSTRVVSRRSGGRISHDTVHRLLRRQAETTAPRWATLDALVTALEGDREHFHALWRRCRDTENPVAPPGPRPARPAAAPALGYTVSLPRYDAGWPVGSLLGRLTDGPRQELLNIGSVVRYPPDREVIQQGAVDTHALLLLEGFVKVLVTDEAGRRALVAVQGVGDLVGELSALDGGPRSATVVTCGDVLARLIPGGELNGFLQRRGDVLVELTRQLAGRLRTAEQGRRDQVSLSSGRRLARVLVALVAQIGEEVDGRRVLRVPLTTGELASLAGTSRLTAKRVLADLVAAGVVAHRHRDLCVVDLDALRVSAGLDPLDPTSLPTGSWSAPR